MSLMLLSGWWTRVRGGVPVLVLAVLAAGCWSAPENTVQPRAGRAGLQLTGTVANTQVAVSDGAPALRVGDCDPDVRGDHDLCVISDDIGGELVVLVIENPDVLAPGVTLPVTDPGCTGGCDDVTGTAVVDLQLGTAPRMRADGGRVEITELTPFTRYVGELRLTLPSGAVSGSFDLVPRSD